MKSTRRNVSQIISAQIQVGQLSQVFKSMRGDVIYAVVGQSQVGHDQESSKRIFRQVREAVVVDVQLLQALQGLESLPWRPRNIVAPQLEGAHCI